MYSRAGTSTRRIRRNTHGVRLLFLQQGRLGRFDFQVLLVQLVSGLALLKVATTLVDLVSFYFSLLAKLFSFLSFEYQLMFCFVFVCFLACAQLAQSQTSVSRLEVPSVGRL